jgi:hypothetical protein
VVTDHSPETIVRSMWEALMCADVERVTCADPIVVVECA